MSSLDDPRRRSRFRKYLLAGGHLAVLSAFALAQPLLDLLSRNPEFFAVRGSSPSDIVLFALALTLVPPGVLLVVEVAAGLVHERLRLVLHLLFVAALAALALLQVAARAGIDLGALTFAAAALLGGLGALLYARAQVVRAILTVLVPAPALFLALFLLTAPVSRLVFPEEVTVQATTVRSTTPVVLVVFDELPTVSLMGADGGIDARRYPAFASLAESSTWYRNATTVHAHTHLAVPAILTGKVPEKGSLPVLADHPDNLFTLLSEDYELRAVEALTRLCPPGVCRAAAEPETLGNRLESLWLDLGVVYLHTILPEDYRVRLPAVSDTWSNFLGQDDDEEGPEEVPDEEERSAEPPPRSEGERQAREALPACDRRVCRFAGLLTRSAGPTLYYLHALLPHAPWLYLPSGRRYTNDVRVIPGNRDGRWGDNAWLATQGYQRHVLQLGYTDRALGILLDRMRDEGIWDAALVIVVADHGGSFRLGQPRRNASRVNLADLAFVPLFVKLPGQQDGGADDSFARTVDVLPTIADVLGVDLPWDVDGRSLASGDLPPNGDVTVPNQQGEPIVAGLAELVAERSGVLAAQVRVLGTGPWSGVYRAGTTQRLLGSAVGEARVVDGSGHVELDGAGLLADVDLEGALRPAYLTGRVSGRPGGELLAVAVQGTVAALTWSYEEEGRTAFAALVPERSFVAGANEVEIFVVRSAGRPPVFDRLLGAELEFQLVDGERIDSSAGERFPIEPDALAGEARLWRRGATDVLAGIAVDPDAKRPAERVVVFVEGRSVFSGRAGNAVSRESSRRYGVRPGGFSFELPAGVLPASRGSAEIRVFALGEQVASELAYDAALGMRAR